VITGTLTQNRSVVAAALIAAGAQVLAKISGKTDIVVAGANAGSKLDLAEAQGVQVWDEDKLNSVLAGKGKGSSKGAAKEKKASKPKRKAKDDSDEEEEDDEPKPKKVKKSSGDLSGKKIVLTGTLTSKRNEIIAEIVSAGGQVMTAVSKNTNILVAGAGSGSKLAQAEALGVDVWTEDELKAALGGGGGSKKASKKVSKKEPKESKKSKKSKKDDDDDDAGSGSVTRLVAGSSSGGKFWEITVSGKSYTTTWGRVGSDGTSKTLAFASAEAAKKEANKKIKAKQREGYN